MSNLETDPKPSGDAPPRVPQRAAKTWLRTPAAKVGMIAILLLIMQIPLLMVGGLIQEREGRQHEVLQTFLQGWGPEQTVAGPLLMVPYTWTESGENQRLHGWLRIPASSLAIGATLQPEERHRGLFHATVYSAVVTLSGALTLQIPLLPDVQDAVVDWKAARIAIGVSDPRGLPAAA